MLEFPAPHIDSVVVHLDVARPIREELVYMEEKVSTVIVYLGADDGQEVGNWVLGLSRSISWERLGQGGFS